MESFDRGETIICSCEVKDSTGVYRDPSNNHTSMSITITNNQNGIEVNDEPMDWDSIGNYHKDFNSKDNNRVGIYLVIYKATDGTRISIKKDTFQLI